MSEVIVNGQTLSVLFASAGLPPGAMVDFAGTAAPTGWLLCDGSAANRVTFASLFAAIGVVWGPGDGFTTFNLPDMRRRTAVGSGGVGTGTLGNAIGNSGGAETHALSIPELASHSHTETAGHNHGITANFTAQVNAQTVDGQEGNGSNFMISPTVNVSAVMLFAPQAGWGTNQASASLDNTGSGTAHNNIQPSAVVMKIIKT